MGLFFKRKKEGKMDIPPPPPEEVGEIKEVAEPEIEEIPELPPLESEEPEKIYPESEIPAIKPAKEESLPEFPEMPEEEPVVEAEEAPALAGTRAEISEAPTMEEGPKFLNISSFQDILSEAENIKNSLKQADASLKEMDAIKEEGEKEFQRWRATLEGVEKKLSYVDRIVFKGE